jgi:hypothetical protein
VTPFAIRVSPTGDTTRTADASYAERKSGTAEIAVSG